MFGRAQPVILIVGHVGNLGFRPMNLNAAQPADHPIGGLGVHMLVCKTEDADNRDMRRVLGAPALKHDMVELVAGDGKRVVTASMPRAARLPRVVPDLARSVPALAKLIHHIGNRVAHQDVTPRFVRAKEQLVIAAISTCTGLS
jgi:hypothetical protein